MGTEKFDLSVVLRFINKATPGMKQFQQSMKNAGRKMKDVGKSMSVAVTAPLVGLGVNAVRIGADFQNTMNMVGAVTNTTGKQFDKLKMVARDLGATTQFSARQAGDAMRFMGMAGFDANKIIAASPKVLELAAAAQLDMGTAANLTTNIMSGFGFQAKDMARVNDVLVNTFTNANVSLPQMGEAMKKVGPIASKMKMRFTEISAALGLMGNAGIQGSEAGVALRRALINLQNPTKNQQKAMAFMELEFKNADGTMKDLTGIIGEYEKAAAKGADETQVMTSMMQIFGPRAVAPMLALLEAGTKGMKEMEEKTKKVGTSSQIAKRQMEGLPGALKLIKSAWESVNIALTEGDFGKWVEGVVRGLAKVMTQVGKFINTHPEITKWGLIVAGIFAAAGPILIGLGAVTIALGAISVPVVAAVAALAGIGVVAATIMKNWGPIKQFFNDMLGGIGAEWDQFVSEWNAEWKRVWEAIPKPIRDFITGTNVDVDLNAPGVDLDKQGSLGQAAKDFIPVSLGGNKSTSEVIIKVTSEKGASAVVAGVKQTGETNLKVENKSNVGLTVPNLATVVY